MVASEALLCACVLRSLPSGGLCIHPRSWLAPLTRQRCPPGTIPHNTQADALLRLPELLSRYAARNLTTAFVPGHRVWTAGAPGAGQFSLDVRIRVPPHQLLLYRRAGWSTWDVGWDVRSLEPIGQNGWQHHGAPTASLAKEP
jgi:hypothetical protein